MQDTVADNERQQPGGRNVPVPAADPRALPLVRDSYGAGSYGTSDFREEGSDLAATIRRFIGIALKWHRLILGVAGVFLVMGAIYAFLSTPLYNRQCPHPDRPRAGQDRGRRHLLADGNGRR